MLFSTQNREKGFTLAELLIAMAISGIILGTIAGTFFIQRKSYDIQEQITEMMQTARASIDMMSREIRMAGYNPADASFDGIPYNANSSTIDVYADNNGSGSIDNPSGSYEHITYSYDSANKMIRRNTNTGGGNQPFAENIQSISFSYWNADDPPKEVTSVADQDEIRMIKITIVAKTAKPDPDYSANSGYRTYTLTSLLTPRNLAL